MFVSKWHTQLAQLSPLRGQVSTGKILELRWSWRQKSSTISDVWCPGRMFRSTPGMPWKLATPSCERRGAFVILCPHPWGELFGKSLRLQRLVAELKVLRRDMVHAKM